MGQQTFVGCAVVQGTAQQQGAVEPTTVLVVAFQIQIGFRALVVMRRTVVSVLVAAAQHVLEGGARVEPDFQNVGALAVVGRVVTGLVQDLFNRDSAPSFNATGLHNVRCLIEDGHGARVQFAAVFVQEKRHWHTPGPLARNAPVGAVGNHVSQTRFAVLGVELGLVNRVQGQLSQGLRRFVLGEHARAFVHADEPLGCRAVDDRCFVTPAMRVAVRDGLCGHQAASGFQPFQNEGNRFPNVLAAKQREVGGISAIALNGVQDVGVLQAMRHAGVEVIHTISRGAVHDARAVCFTHIVGDVNRRGALIARIHMRQRMVKFNQTKFVAGGGGQHLAFELPTL